MSDTEKNKTKAEVIQLRFDDNNLAQNLFGPQGAHLKSLENELGIDILVKSGELALKGEEDKIQFASQALSKIYELLKKGYPISGRDFEDSVRMLQEDQSTELHDVFRDAIFIPSRKKVISPRSLGQKKYIQAIRDHDLIFGVGPAGTGKTYLAVVMAVTALLKGDFEKIVLTRPAIEAGEKLGFLPGDLVEKINPYLRPLYDAMHDLIDSERAQRLIDKGMVEVAPLAFMRGRTLSKSFVILDEAQNTTREQMKMFLTRMGDGSKMVVTGDVTQIDLPNYRESGLVNALDILQNIKEISIQRLRAQDVVRHSLVQKVVQAYDTFKF